eukprot:6655401-Prymnesium_polylepis.1
MMQSVSVRWPPSTRNRPMIRTRKRWNGGAWRPITPITSGPVMLVSSWPELARWPESESCGRSVVTRFK